MGKRYCNTEMGGGEKNKEERQEEKSSRIIEKPEGEERRLRCQLQRCTADGFLLRFQYNEVVSSV